MNLRDHSQACEHAPNDYTKVWGDGFHIGHDYQWAPAHSAWCPGGREVTIDYEAARAVLERIYKEPVALRHARLTVDSAIGDTDE